MAESRSVLVTLAFVVAFALSALLFGTWWAAWVNGGSVTVYINRYDEAVVELLVWSVVTAVLAVGLQQYLTEP